MMRKTILAFLLSFLLPLSGANGDEATLERLRGEGVRAWGMVAQRYSGASFGTETRIQDYGGGVQIREWASRSMTSRYMNCFRIDVSGTRDSEKAKATDGEVEGTIIGTDRYVASIELRGARPSLGAFYGEAHPDYQRKLLNYLGVSIPGLRYFKDFLPNCLVGFPSFHGDPNIDRAYVAEDAVVLEEGSNAGMVELLLGFAEPNGQGEFERAPDCQYVGRVTLDPKRMWCVVTASEDFINPDGSVVCTRSSAFEYSTAIPDSPHPTRITTVMTIAERNIKETKELLFTELEPSSIACADCSLSAYRLPEPEERRRREWLRTLLIVMVLCISAVYVVRRIGSAD